MQLPLLPLDIADPATKDQALSQLRVYLKILMTCMNGLVSIIFEQCRVNKSSKLAKALWKLVHYNTHWCNFRHHLDEALFTHCVSFGFVAPAHLILSPTSAWFIPEIYGDFQTMFERLDFTAEQLDTCFVCYGTSVEESKDTNNHTPIKYVTEFYSALSSNKNLGSGVITKNQALSPLQAEFLQSTMQNINRFCVFVCDQQALVQARPALVNCANKFMQDCNKFLQAFNEYQTR